MENNYQDFEEYLSILNSKVRNNTEIVKAEDLKQPFMLHIDKKVPDKFIPMMPRSAATSEDNTVPRITVADTLIGCVMGYARTLNDFFSDYNAGYIISILNFEYCLKPNNKLVFDAEITGEHWLIGYNKQTLSYKPKPIGKIFLHSCLSVKRRIEQKNKEYHIPFIDELTLYFEIDQAIYLNPDKLLDKGYYKYILFDDFLYNHNYKTKDNYKISKVTEKEYMQAKTLSATMLSLNNVLTRW